MPLRLSNSRLKSICWIFLWSFCFAVAMSLVKLIPDINTATIISVRFFIATLIVLPVLLRTHTAGIATFKTTQLPRHLLNSIFRVSAIWSTYYAYSKLPLAFAASIGFTGPMVAILLAMLLLKEEVGWRKWLAVLVGYGGVLVMVQPESTAFNIAILIALLANLGSSLAKIITKEITKTDSTPLIMFYSNLIGLVISLGLAGYEFTMPTGEGLLILVAIGLIGSLSQFSYLRALHHGDVSLVAPFEYSRLLFALPIGFIVFDEVPGLNGVIGSLIIIASSVYLTQRELSKPAIESSVEKKRVSVGN